MHVSFAEYSFFYRALLQNRPMFGEYFPEVSRAGAALSSVDCQKKCQYFSKVSSLLQWLYIMRGGGLGSRPRKMYGERLGDGVEYHLMSPTPRR